MVFKKGHKSWNEGLTKETNNKLKIIGQHISKTNKGRPSTFKGKTHTLEVRQKMSDRQKGNKNWLGKHHTQETKNKISLSQKGENNNLWKGGRMKVKGYIKIYFPTHPYSVQGHVLEHRLVMEKYLKRFLLPEEVVHHINEIKEDNRIENLMLFKNKGEHKRFHLKQTRERLIELNKENIDLKEQIKKLLR